jgi:hypothetical protein
MGILDIYGFEIFERNRWGTDTVNSLKTRVLSAFLHVFLHSSLSWLQLNQLCLNMVFLTCYGAITLCYVINNNWHSRIELRPYFP